MQHKYMTDKCFLHVLDEELCLLTSVGIAIWLSDP